MPTMEVVLKIYDGLLSAMVGETMTADVKLNGTGKYLDSWLSYYKNHEYIRVKLISRGWIPSSVTDLNDVNSILDTIVTPSIHAYVFALSQTILKKKGVSTDVLGSLLWLWIHALSIPTTISNADYCSVISSLYIYQLCPACKTHMNENYLRFLDALHKVENSTCNSETRYMISSQLHSHITRAIKDRLPKNPRTPILQPRQIDSIEATAVYRKLVAVWSGQI
jgi:hypothetical protein